MRVENIAVLGRGGSLRKFKKFSDLFETIYIVGNFYKEIKKIGVKYFKDKKIIHLISRTDRPLRNGYYKKLNIVRIQTMYHPHQLVSTKKYKKGILEKFKNFKIEFLPDYMKNRGYPLVDRKIIYKYMKEYDNYKDMNIFIEKNFKKEIERGVEKNRRSRYWPTTGIYALDLCLVESLPENIYIFGIDAFKNLSYVKYNWEPGHVRENKDASLVSKLMIYHMEEMAKEFCKTKFYSSTDSIKINQINWNKL